MADSQLKRRRRKRQANAIRRKVNGITVSPLANGLAIGDKPFLLELLGEHFILPRGKYRRWCGVYKCECGKITVCDSAAVSFGSTQSCGCLSSPPGESNPNWRGGRVTDPRGYVLIRVGTDHHLADVRGYAYEHRIVGEQKIGRRLLENEIVHHKDENRQNNHPDNLEVVLGNSEHFFLHRKVDSGRREPGEANPEISCACGCGGTFLKYDSSGRPRSYLWGHNNNG